MIRDDFFGFLNQFRILRLQFSVGRHHKIIPELFKITKKEVKGEIVSRKFYMLIYLCIGVLNIH